MGNTYTRQSTFTDGDTIQAADSNDEFDQLVLAFTADSGHSHDGTGGEGGDVTKLLGTAITIGDGTAGTDIAVTFDGESNDGVLTWMEDEDHFKFSDDVVIDGSKKLFLSDEGGESLLGDGTDLTVASGGAINLTATTDVVVPTNVGVTFGTGEKIEGDDTDLTVTSGADINLTATSDINVPTDVGITFGDDGEKIEGDGTNLTISSSAIATVDAGTDIVLDAGGGDIFFKDDGTTFGSMTNTSGDLIIKSGTTTAMTMSGADVTFSGTVTIGSAGISEAELEILDGATVTTTEFNIIDGDTSATSTTVADADRVVFNDDGTMKQVAVTDLAAYFDDEITAMPNLVTTGALDSGSISSGFGSIDNGASNITSGGLVKIDVDADADDRTGDSATGRLTLGASEDFNLYHGGTNSYIVNDTGDLVVDTLGDIVLDADGGDIFFGDNGVTFGSATNSSGDLIIKSGTTTAMTFSGADVTFAGTVTIGSAGISEAELEILDGATVTTTELNIMDGDTSATSTTVVDADRVVFNDDGTMKQVAVTDLAAYLDDEITAMPNLVTTGALDSGSISSGFGSIDNGTSNITSGGLLSIDVDADADDRTGDSATGRLTIGASEDLNLYHGGTNSYIVNDTGDLVVDTAGDIVLDADGGDVFFGDDGVTFGSATNTSGNLIIKSGTTTALTFSGANVTAAGTIGSGAITSTGTVTATGFTIGSAEITETELEILDGANVTTSELNLLDGSAKSTSSITIADTDAFIVIDGSTTKQIPASNIGSYANTDSTNTATALAIALG